MKKSENKNPWVQTSHYSKWGAWVALILYLGFVIGLWFHTSESKAVFTKYHTNYFISSCLLTFIAPFVYLGTRLLLGQQQMILPSGRTLRFTPLKKITILLFFTGILIIFSEILIFLDRPDRTKSLKAFHPFLQIQAIAGNRNKHINQWGFRGEEITKIKPKDAYRIFVVGGSTVFCDRVNFEESHARILEKKLRAHDPEATIQVQNAGMHWHTTLHSLIKLATIIPEFKPDLVILYHAINDLSRSFENKRFSFRSYKPDYSHYLGPLSGMINAYQTQDRPVRLGIISFLDERFFFHISRCWFSDLRKAEKIPGTSIKTWKSLSSFERNVRSIIHLTKSMKIDLILASQPFLYHENLTEKDKKKLMMWNFMLSENGKKPSMQSMAAGMDRFNETSRQVAKEHGIPYCDLEAKVPKTFEYFMDEVHYTATGNKIIGETLAEFVINQTYIQPK